MKGGGLDNEKSGSLCPLFLGYYEESHFLSPHYQSVVPVRDNTVLEMVLNNDGYDVSKELGLAGQFYFMCRLFSFLILSFN